MKLLIQIPCHNEELTLLEVLKSIPKKFENVDIVDIQVIDDASTDSSFKIAKDFGVKYILQNPIPCKRNLGTVFQLGQQNAIENDYDILVNMDADNQYPARYLGALISPIIENQADMVIGDRNPSKIIYFSKTKRFIQKISNWIVSALCLKHVPDAVSGFRAMNKKTLTTLILKEKYTYTVESLMQAYAKKLRVSWVNVEVNSPSRKSKLIQNIFMKILRSGFASIKFFFLYNFLKLAIMVLALFFFIQIFFNV